jgi:DNA-binding CsgD family transcriptional regulator
MPLPLQLARDEFARGAWSEALAAYGPSTALDPDDHERVAIAAYLTGDDERCERSWEAAHRAALGEGDTPSAARYSFWLAFCLMMRGQMAQAGGWLSRTESILDESGKDCAASGYVLIPAVLGKLGAHDGDGARELAVRALAVGRRCDDADLQAFGLLGVGQALIALGDTAGGRARLDEVMVSVTRGEVGPITSGIVYCAVIVECMALFDLPRAAEWTDALSDWCDAQPDLVPYRGQCLVHRSQLQMVTGQWAEAITTAEAACRRLTDPPHPALGLAYYQEGELHRLVGHFDAAVAAYREASRRGYDPVPGSALLELARGDTAAAATAIRRALHEGENPALLTAGVDILRAAGDVAGARSAADQLVQIAHRAPSPVVDAMAAYARGAVLVAEGDPVAALPELRAATRAWRTLRMPHEAARAAVMVGLACAALGDHNAAALEFENARATFAELDARPDLARLDALIGPPQPAGDAAGLSDREREVLMQLAAGRTNREVASVLHISQHTVGRHVENIFTKLGVTSRAAATARAYELGLIPT